MIVAGGIYSEVCVSPPSHSLFGSGGRAALALTGFTPHVELHAFQPARLADEVYPNFEPFGVDVHLYPSADRVHFRYLHPLARPRISPIPLPTAGSVEVKGEAVLRFGCLEGDFRIKGETVVYDPQTAVAPAAFRANGSTADRLAIVLNRAELKAATASSEMSVAVQILREADGAEVVIVKAGPDGAYVYEAGVLVGHIPAYEASAIHKVGSGDTFSAAFAYYWMRGGRSALDSARFASLHTAEYVETRRPIFRAESLERQPKASSAATSALVALGREGASAEWLLDEAMNGLWDLGVTARVHEGAFPDAPHCLRDDEVLLLLDPGQFAASIAEACTVLERRVVAYCEAPLGVDVSANTIDVKRELTAALYAVAWAF